MKKIVATVGLVALGAVGINTLHAQDISSAPTKSWNVSASVRGFYDDNINALEDNSGSTNKSFGFEVVPGASLNWGNDQTTVKVGYRFGLRYYDQEPYNATDNTYMTHTFDGTLNHSFNERYHVTVGDIFALGQEPDVMRASSGAYSQLRPVSGDNMHNLASLYFNAQLSPSIGAQVGYVNEWVDYADDAGDGSLAAFMNRMGHTFSLDGQWQIKPQTTGILGYQFNLENYTGDQIIGFGVPSGTPIYSDNRNAESHYLYIGADHVFRPDLSGGFRGGMRHTIYPENIEGSSSETKPYFKANLRYAYTVESHAEIGVNYDRVPTDVANVAGDSIALDVDSFVLYGSIQHKFSPKLRGSVIGTVQNSVINGGANDDETQLYYNVGVNLTYRFNTHFSSEIGYNYDTLNSDVDGYDYDRNRAYLGVTATY
jgi:hypothetical protein